MDGSYFPIFDEHLGRIATSLERIEGHLAVLAEEISERMQQQRLVIEARHQSLKEELAAATNEFRARIPWTDQDRIRHRQSEQDMIEIERELRSMELAQPWLREAAK